MYLRDLDVAVRRSGLKVVELPGWEHRGRPSYTGDFSPRGVLCHHTGSSSDSRAYADWMANTGRSDLPAPLVQLALDRRGLVYLCAAGRSNHAGTAQASGPVPAGDGNALYIGIEAMNTGSEGWTRRQRRAYVKLCAALCKHYGWRASHVRAHRETSTTGKWDPGKLDMDKHRAAVRKLLNADTRAERRKARRAERRAERIRKLHERAETGRGLNRARAIIRLAVLRTDDAELREWANSYPDQRVK